MKPDFRIKDVWGRGLYEHNQIIRLTSAIDNKSESNIFYFGSNENNTFSPGRYILPRFVMLNNGSIVPSYIGFYHLSPNTNTVEFIYLVTPTGLVDVRNSKDLRKHGISLNNPDISKIFFDLDNDVSQNIVKRFYFGSLSKNKDLTYGYLSDIYDTSVESKIIDLEQKIESPADINYQFLLSNYNPTCTLVLEANSDSPENWDLIENYCLMKFRNGIHALGSIHREIESQRIIGLSLFHNYILMPLDIIDIEKYFGDAELEKICPVEIYTFDIDKSEHKIRLVHVEDITSECFESIVNNWCLNTR